MAEEIKRVFTGFLVFTFLQLSSPLKLSISPTHATSSTSTSTVVDVNCTADGVLEACQFNLWSLERNEEIGLINPSSNTTSELYEASSEANLTSAVCSLTITRIVPGRYVVSCRMRAKSRGWIYKYMTLFSTEQEEMMSVYAQPGEEFAIAGNRKTISWTSPLPMESCSFTYFSPHDNRTLLTNTTYSNFYDTGAWLFGGSVSAVSYLDSDGLVCSVTLSNLGQKDSGVVWARIMFPGGYNLSSASLVVVSDPPLRTQMTYQIKDYTLGSRLGVSCSTLPFCCRPPSDISWYLNGVRMDKGVEEDVDNDWLWSWGKACRTSAVRRKFVENDDGKNLTCVLNHIGIEKPSSVSTILHMKPKHSSSGAITGYALFGGGTGLFILVKLLQAFCSRLTKNERGQTNLMT